eukprot:2155945-Rhodomonas_salina.1
MRYVRNRLGPALAGRDRGRNLDRSVDGRWRLSFGFVEFADIIHVSRDVHGVDPTPQRGCQRVALQSAADTL